MRAFVAIELPPTHRTALLRFVRDECPSSREIRYCTEEQMHITLKFLGDMPAERLDEAIAVITSAAQSIEPFAVDVGGLGAFPSARQPRVLWVGVTDAGQHCRQWVERADPGFAELGFAPEERAYTPHITLGRSRSPAGSRVMQLALRTLVAPHLGVVQVEEVVLMESQLRPTGAVYRSVARVRLGKAR